MVLSALDLFSDSLYAAKDSLFLSIFKRVGLWGTISQVSMRFPLIKPVIWLLVPPSVAVSVPRLLAMNRKEVQRRLSSRNELHHPDYFESLLPKNSPDHSEEWLLAQANVLVVAGFDPSTNLLSSALYYLLAEPSTLQTLATEIREAFPYYGEINFDQLPRLKYLHAVIDESLRLHTNAGFGLPRVCPGAMIDGHLIPSGVGSTLYYLMFSETSWTEVLSRPLFKPASLLRLTLSAISKEPELSVLLDGFPKATQDMIPNLMAMIRVLSILFHLAQEVAQVPMLAICKLKQS